MLETDKNRVNGTVFWHNPLRSTYQDARRTYGVSGLVYFIGPRGQDRERLNETRAELQDILLRYFEAIRLVLRSVEFPMQVSELQASEQVDSGLSNNATGLAFNYQIISIERLGCPEIPTSEQIAQLVNEVNRG